MKKVKKKSKLSSKSKKLSLRRGYNAIYERKYLYFLGVILLVVVFVIVIKILSASASVVASFGSGGPISSDISASEYLKANGSLTTKALNVNSVNLSRYTPPVVSQLPINSCVSVSFAYEAIGWYANRDGYYPPGGFAPMFIYSQIAKANGGDIGSFPETVLSYLKKQGVDTSAHYKKPINDYRDQPTASDRANAAQYKIQGYKAIFVDKKLHDTSSSDKEQAIKAAMIDGNPVVVDFSMPSCLMRVTHGQMANDCGGANRYGHEMFADNFNSTGLGLVNTWGKSWGNSGRAIMPWKYVAKYARAAYVIIPPNPSSISETRSKSEPTPTKACKTSSKQTCYYGKWCTQVSNSCSARVSYRNCYTRAGYCGATPTCSQVKGYCTTLQYCRGVQGKTRTATGCKSGQVCCK